MSDADMSVKPASLSLVATGTKIWSSGAAVQLPDVKCRVVHIKALGGNVGMVGLGGSTVAMPAAANSTTNGYELDAGDPAPPVTVQASLNELYIIADNASDGICYACYGG